MHAYLYALEIDPVELHTTYTSLPLHCTIMQWFFTGAEPDDLRVATARVFSTRRAVSLRSHKRALFGPRENVPVHTVRPHHALKCLHFDLLQALEGFKIRHMNEEYSGRGFRPHVSDVCGMAFGPGSAHIARHVYLVQAHPDQLLQKRVIERTALGV